MDFEQKNYIERFIQKIKFGKRLSIGFFIIISFIFPLLFLINTIKETNSLGRVLLGDERYTARMNDSYLYAVVMLALILVITIPTILYFNRFFNRYSSIIYTLSDKDADKLKNQNDNSYFLERYMPSYIIKEKTVTFFTIFTQKALNFNDISKLTVQHVYVKGGSCYIVKIQTIYATRKYKLPGNYFLIQNLINEALIANPQIEVNKDWNR